LLLELKKALVARVRVLVPLVIMTPVLALFGQPVNYLFYAAAVSSAIILYSTLVLGTKRVEIRLRETWADLLVRRALSSLMLFLGSLLLTADSLRVITISPLVNLATRLLVGSFLSGYALVNLLPATDLYPSLERLVLSFTLGYSFTALLTFLFQVILRSQSWQVLVYLTYIMLSILSAMRRSPRGRDAQRERVSFSISAGSTCLLLVAVFFFLATWSCFPELSTRIGTDLQKHYWWAVVLIRSPQLYSYHGYLWFHCFSAFVAAMQGSLLLENLGAIQTGLAFFSLMSNVAFYSMVRSATEKFDGGLAGTSTIIYSLFSGLTWIYFARISITQGGLTEFELLSAISDATFWQNMYTQGLWFWGFLPLVVAMTHFFVLLSLIFRSPSRESMILFSVLFASMSLSHISLGIILSLLLSVMSFTNFGHYDSRRYLLCTLMGWLVVLLAWCGAAYRTTVVPDLGTWTACLVIALSAFSYMASGKRHLTLSSWLGGSLRALVPLLAIGFVASILTWAMLAGDFRLNTSTWTVPWYFYSPLLGVTGLLAIAGVYYCSTNNNWLSTLWPFVAMTGVAFILAIAISLVYGITGIVIYWEQRMIYFIHAGCAVLAAFGIEKCVSLILGRGRRPALAMLLLSLVALSGTMSTFMAVQYWYYNKGTNGSTYRTYPSGYELEALNFMSETFSRYPYSTVASVSWISRFMLMFSAPPYMSGQYKFGQLSMVKYPETALFLLDQIQSYARVLALPDDDRRLYIYVQTRDNLSYVRWRYLLGHLLANLAPVFRNQEVNIFEVPQLSWPLIDSDVCLIIPFERARYPDYLVAYDLMAFTGYRYTMAFDRDDFWTFKNTVILSYDPIARSDLDRYWSYVQGGGELVILNTNGNGLFFQSLFDETNMAMNATMIVGNGNLSVPEVPVSMCRAKSFSDVRGWYVSPGLLQVPYATETSVGKGKVTYVNIFPLISAWNNLVTSGAVKDLLPATGVVITDSHESIGINYQMTFRKARLNGTARAVTDSVLLPSRLDPIQLSVTVGGNRTEFQGVSSVMFRDCRNVSIDFNYAEISDGQGLYIPLSVLGLVRIRLDGDGTSVIVISDAKGGSKETLISGSSIRIELNVTKPLTLFARTPHIRIVGQSTFQDVCVDDPAMLRGVQAQIGGELRIEGSLDFELYYSDFYTSAGGFRW